MHENNEFDGEAKENVIKKNKRKKNEKIVVCLIEANNNDKGGNVTAWICML